MSNTATLIILMLKLSQFCPQKPPSSWILKNILQRALTNIYIHVIITSIKIWKVSIIPKIPLLFLFWLSLDPWTKATTDLLSVPTVLRILEFHFKQIYVQLSFQPKTQGDSYAYFWSSFSEYFPPSSSFLFHTLLGKFQLLQFPQVLLFVSL